MNYIFIFLIVFSIICALITGKIELAINEMFSAAKDAVELAFGLIGIMAFWLGIVNISKESGLMDIVSKIIEKPILWIFPDLKENKEAQNNIALNVSANALGLGNAATPFGIKAMEDMQKNNKNKNVATNDMCTFLAMNTAGFQIIPALVLAILAANKMDNPSQIIIPTLIVTTIAFISAIFFSKTLERFFK